MILPEKIRQKYLSRFEDLIETGEKIPVKLESITHDNPFTNKRRHEVIENIDWPIFVEWRANCVTLLDQIIPKNSAHRSIVGQFGALNNIKNHLEYGISSLKAIKSDFERGYFEDLPLEIEAELTSDYMRQAENLLNEGTVGRYDHVPAAVLAGAVLEKSLRTMCHKLSPPEPIVKDNGSPLMLNALIDRLKIRKVYNEQTTKQLRAWADIRNNAAHGNFDQFNKQDVEAMISRIKSFLIEHLKKA